MRLLPAYFADADGRRRRGVVVELDAERAVVLTDATFEAGTRLSLRVGLADGHGALAVAGVVSFESEGNRLAVDLDKPSLEDGERLAVLARTDPGGPPLDRGGRVVWPITAKGPAPTAEADGGGALQIWTGSGWSSPPVDGVPEADLEVADPGTYEALARAALAASGVSAASTLAYRGRLIAPLGGLSAVVLGDEGSPVAAGLAAQMAVVDGLAWLGPPLRDPQFLPLESLSEARVELDARLAALGAVVAAGEPAAPVARAVGAALKALAARVDGVLHTARAAVALEEDRRQCEGDKVELEPALTPEAQQEAREAERKRQEAEAEKEQERAARRAERQAEARARAEAAEKEAKKKAKKAPKASAPAPKKAPVAAVAEDKGETKGVADYGAKEWAGVVLALVAIVGAVGYGLTQAGLVGGPSYEESVLPERLRGPYDVEPVPGDASALVATMPGWDRFNENQREAIVADLCSAAPEMGMERIEIRDPGGTRVAGCEGPLPVGP